MKTSPKFTIHFDQLTTKAVEMFKNMGDIENAKLWVDDFVMTVGCDEVEIIGLMALLQAIKVKADDPIKTDHPSDFIDDLQRHLFCWTMDFEQILRAYNQAISTGDFTVEKLIESEKKEIAQPAKNPFDDGFRRVKNKINKNLNNPDVVEAARAIHILLNNKTVPTGLYNLIGDYVADMRADMMSAQGGETVEYIAEGLAHAQET